MDIMATAQNIVEESWVDDEIDQIANEIAEEIKNDLAEAAWVHISVDLDDLLLAPILEPIESKYHKIM